MAIDVPGRNRICFKLLSLCRALIFIVRISLSQSVADVGSSLSIYPI